MMRLWQRDALSALGGVLLIARRELAAYFRTPLGYVVAVLFAILQGVSFWYVLGALANPSRPAPMGAVLFSHFGGSVLATTVLVALVSVLSMRLMAEDRRQGTWEILATAPIPEAAVIAGKWLGGCAFYAFSWLPSTLYPLVLLHYAPASQSLDFGPIGSSLLSILCTGSALMAVGVAASAATSNQLVAALATTVITMSWLLLGDVVHIAPQSQSEHVWLGAVLAHIDIRGHMDDMARGLVSSPALVLYASTVVFGLCAALTLALIGQRRTREMYARVAATVMVLGCLVFMNILAARHPLEWDVTRAREHTLDARTLAILARIGDLATSDQEDRVVEIHAVRASLDSFADIQAQVDRLLERIARTQPALQLRWLEPTLEPGRLAEIARETAVPMENLRDGGVVVFQRGSARRSVDVLDIAEIAADDLGIGRLAAFRAEQAFANALAELIDPEQPTLCYTTGHGELPLGAPGAAGADAAAASANDLDWSGIGQWLLRDRYRLESVDILAGGIPGACRVLIMAGPSQPVTPSGAHAVHEFLARGGRLLLALADLDADRAPRTGLELVLASYGIELPAVRVLDPEAPIDQTGAAWFTTSGYGPHPITAGFADRRLLTLWLGPRAVLWHAPGPAHDFRLPDDIRPVDAAVLGTVLVRSSARGYGEPIARGTTTNIDAPPSADVIRGPVSVAVAVTHESTGARLVVIGGAHSLSPRLTESHGSAGELLLIRSLDWLAGRDRQLDIPAKTPEHLRLIMSPGALRAAFALCVLIIPGVLALIGLLVWWRRRRA